MEGLGRGSKGDPSAHPVPRIEPDSSPISMSNPDSNRRPAEQISQAQAEKRAHEEGKGRAAVGRGTGHGSPELVATAAGKGENSHQTRQIPETFGFQSGRGQISCLLNTRGT